MSDSIELILDGLIEREQGFVDHPADHGGPTNWGITLPVFSEVLGHKATVSELQALSEVDAREIYRTKYVIGPGFLRVKDELIRELLVDCEVNHRPGVAVKFLQRALGVTVDGVLGPKTLAALDTADTAAVFREMAAERVEFYGRIVADDHSQAVFAAGWNARAAVFVRKIPLGT